MTRPQVDATAPSRWPRVVAVGTVPLAVALIVVGAIALQGTVEVAYAEFLLTAVLSVPLIAVGNAIAHREPRNVVGPLMAVGGVVVVGVGAWDTYTLAALAHPERLPTWDLLNSLIGGGGGWAWLYVPFALIALYFPTGRLPSSRWRPVVVLLPLIATAFPVLGAVHPTPYDPPFQDVPKALGILPLGEDVYSVAATAMLAVFAACLIASAVSLRVRYRHADDVERAQLRWLALAGLTIPGTLVLAVVGHQVDIDLVTLGYATMIVAIPAAIAIAILRHDLYDVDRVLSTAVTYGLVTAVLLVLFGVTSAVGGLAIGDSRVATATATAACALVLHPLRHRLQGAVDARVYPLRQAALAAIEDLRRRTTAGECEPEELEATLRQALRDPLLQVVYRMPGCDASVDAEGRPHASTKAAVPVRSGMREIGVIIPHRPLPPALGRDIATAAAVLAELAVLRMELHHALEDVAASRTRLLHAGYAERRRLERDLHDGAQQRLVSLGMALRVAQRHIDDGTLDVGGLFDEAVVELSTAVAELRQIAGGLRPSALDEGLGPALEVLASTAPFAIDLDVRAGELDDAVSTTAFYVAAEALTNAVKHARAERISLSVAQDDGRVEVLVRDDGLGGAVLRPGSGLAGLRDRVAALGGSLDLSSAAGAGTEVRAVLPCPT